MYPTTVSVNDDHRRQLTKTTIAATAINCRHQPPPKLLTANNVHHHRRHRPKMLLPPPHHHNGAAKTPSPPPPSLPLPPLDRRWLYPTAASDDNDSHPCPHCPSHCPPSEEDQTVGWRARCGACHSSSHWLLLWVSSLLSCQYLRPGRGWTPQPHHPCACRQLSPALLYTDASPHVTISAGPLHVVHIVLNLIVASFGGGGG